MVYCCIPYCTSKSGKSKGISFHYFPCDSSLEQKWLKAISRENFTPNNNAKSVSQAVCSLHFQDTDYKTGLKKRCLKPLSVPSIFPSYPSYKVPKLIPARRLLERKDLITHLKKNNEKDSFQPQLQKSVSAHSLESASVSVTEVECSEALTPSDFLYMKCSIDNSSQTSWNIDSVIHRLKQQNKSLMCKNFRLNAKVKKLQSDLDEARQKLHVFENDKVHSCLDKVIKAAGENNDHALILTEQILNFGKKVKQWDSKTLTKCVGLRFCSPKAYAFIQRNKILKLPCKSTLSTFIGNVSYDTGITPLIKERLKNEINNLSPHERYGSIIVDEMAIKSQMLFDKKKDDFLGQEDVSKHVQKSRDIQTPAKKVQLANNMLFFMLQGLSTNYRIPVAYFFSKQLCGRDLHALTLSVLKEVEAIGYFVIRIVTDNHKVNACMMKLLAGGKLTYEIPHPFCNERKLFLSFDPCHLIKNIRNFFLEKQMPDGNGVISGSYVKKLYNIQEPYITKLVRFLTRKHIEPNNLEKMNVKRAVQIFWPQVIAALKFLKQNPSSHPNAPFFSNANSTILFMEYVQKWFLLHNISNRSQYINLNDTDRKHFFDVSDERLDWLENDFLPYIQNLHECSKKENEVFLSAETFEALVMTSKSTIACIKYLLESGFHFVLTRNFTSDAIELFFSSLRQNSGGNDMLDSRSIIFSMNYILKTGILSTPSTGNACMDSGETVLKKANLASVSSSDEIIKNLSFEESIAIIPGTAVEILKGLERIEG